MQIIFGILITALGAYLVLKTEWFLETFGRVAWFDQNLGTEGGSRLGYKLLGILVLFLGIIMMTGSGDSFMGWATSPLTQYTNPKQ
jgi:hypothetical protein